MKKQLEPLGMMAPDTCSPPSTSAPGGISPDLVAHINKVEDDAPC